MSVEVQNLDESHELETRVPTSLIMHATERLRRKNGVHLHAMEVGIGPHVDHDVQDAEFNETRLLSQKYYDQYTGLELDPAGTAAARQSEIDFSWRLKAFEPPPRTEAYQRLTVTRRMSNDRSFGVVWLSKRHVRLAPSASRISQL